MKERQISSTAHPMPFLMVSSTDHITGVTGLTPTVTISKDGGTFAAPAGTVTVTELGSGWYALAGNATDRNTNGTFLLHATGTGADPSDTLFTIVPWDPFDAKMGLVGLPGVAPAAAGGLPILGTGTGSINPSGGKVPATLAAGDVTGNVPVIVNAYASGQAPLQPAVAGRTLGVNATGQAGIDWANIGGATTTVNLSGTTVGTITTLTNLPAATTDWLTAAAVKADAVTKIQAGLSTYAGGAVASVSGDVAGKVLGGGAGTITGTGVRAVDGSGNALGTATGQTAILTDTGALVSRITTGRAGNLDRLDATISGIAATILVTPANKLATNPDGSLPGLIPADAGTAVAGGTITQFSATGAGLSTQPSAYNGQAIKFDSGVNKGEWRKIQAYTLPSGTPQFLLATADAFTNPPGNDPFRII